MRLKILHIIWSVSPQGGGPIEGIVQQDSAGKPLGVKREIVSLDAPDDAWVQACPVKTYPMGLRTPFLRAKKKFIPWLRYGYSPHVVPWLKQNMHRYDLVVVNGMWNYTAFAARRALKKASVPYVVYAHGMLDPWFRSYRLKTMAKQVFWWFVEGRLLNNANAVLFTTDSERLLAQKAFWPYRIKEKAIAYGTNDVGGDAKTQAEAFYQKVPAVRGRPFLLFLSRLHVKKGCDLLLRAFAKIAPANPQLDLVMAGPDQTGWQAELMQLAKDLGLESRVHWPGMLQGDVKWGAYRAAEAFVLPSHQENFGIVVAEALACAKPVLITDKVGICFDVSSEKAGLVESDTQDGIDRLLQNFIAMKPEEKTAMSAAARACFLKRYELRSVVDKIIGQLEDIVGKRAA